MKVLVVGGAGFIGSHMVKMLGQYGCNVTTLDDLSSGFRDAVLFGSFIEGSLQDTDLLDDILSRGFDAVIHFASFIQVGESVINPARYYRNNVVNSINLLDAMVKHGVYRIIFSSTAAIFGEPQYYPLDEHHPLRPINPYGYSKMIVEKILADYDTAYGLKSICLRYFNAAGADPDGQLGERHNPETHLIPLVLQVASGRRENINVYGRDYDTKDGTCIRDYIHVNDLCSAHWLALTSLIDQNESCAYNLGNGSGFSVQDVIKIAEDITGKRICIIDAPRRLGDPAVLVADSKLAQVKLGWKPRFSILETIIEHAWKWEIKFNSL